MIVSTICSPDKKGLPLAETFYDSALADYRTHNYEDAFDLELVRGGIYLN